jgi:predicted porin
MYITQKKLLAAAVAVACVAPLAAQAQVTVYGKLYPQVNHYTISGATAAGAPVSTLSAPASGADSFSGNVMESSNSRIGFRGKEDLGNGLSAFFQLETAFAVDDGTLNNTALFNRDTFVGMGGGFGTVKLGRMDTVYKNLGDTLSFLGISSGNFVAISNILSARGFGGNSAHRFHERLANTVMYETPEFGDFQALVGYSLGEVAGDNKERSAISTGVKYEAGPLYLAVAYEQHNDYFGGSRNSPTAGMRNTTGTTGAAYVIRPGAESKDTAVRFTAQYKLTSNTRVEANFAQTELDETPTAAGRFANYKHNSWTLAGEHKMGPWTLAAAYGQAGAGSCSLGGGVACSTSGLDGKMLNLGAGYSFSKRTMLYGMVTQMRNGHSAMYNNGPEDITPGQDIRQIALGISHTF